jgi:hypothetical protein
MVWASSCRVFPYDFRIEWNLQECVSLYTSIGIFDDAMLYRYILHPDDIVIVRHSRVLMWAWHIASFGWWGMGFGTQYYSHTGFQA